MILLSGLITATTTDLLQGTRLDSVPYMGTLTFQFQANLADATNNYTLKIQRPNGDVPIEDQLIPAGAAGTTGVLDDRELLQLSLPASQGGHFIVALTETGAAVCTYRVILSP